VVVVVVVVVEGEGRGLAGDDHPTPRLLVQLLPRLRQPGWLARGGAVNLGTPGWPPAVLSYSSNPATPTHLFVHTLTCAHCPPPPEPQNCMASWKQPPTMGGPSIWERIAR
jgi:hypothetical protein